MREPTSVPRAEWTGAPALPVLQSYVGEEGALKKPTFKEALHFIPFNTLPNANVTNVRSGNLTSYTNPALP